MNLQRDDLQVEQAGEVLGKRLSSLVEEYALSSYHSECCVRSTLMPEVMEEETPEQTRRRSK